MQIFYQYSSKNYDLRPESRNPIRYIILHYTELPIEEALFMLCDSSSKVSAHYLIKKNGTIFQLVGEFYRAWHAGVSCWKAEEALNNSSIGIEIDNLGDEPFTDEQMNSVVNLCKYLTIKYNIPRFNVLAHSDIALSRKIDPGIYFDWHFLATQGIGHQFIKNNSKSPEFLTLSKNDIIDVQTKLKKVGYNTKITGELDKQTSDVFRAFQLHFNPQAIKAQLSSKSLFNLENHFLWDNVSYKILNLLDYSSN